MSDHCCFCDTRNFRLEFAKDGSQYYRCTKCGFLKYASLGNANLDQMLGAYEPAYLSYLDEGPQDEVQFGSLWQWMQSCGATAGSRVADVGCGSGKFVRYLRGQHFQAVGIEPAKALFDRFLQSQDFFFSGTLDEFVASTGTAQHYDIVTAFDVLEHVQNPVSVMQRAASIVKPGGLLFLSTPDAGSLAARVLGKHWYHYHRYHLSLMNVANIKALAAKANMEIVAIRHLSRYKSVQYLISYLMNFGFRSKRSIRVKQIAKLVIPINTYDVSFACFRRPGEGGSV